MNKVYATTGVLFGQALAMLVTGILQRHGLIICGSLALIVATSGYAHRAHAEHKIRRLARRVIEQWDQEHALHMDAVDREAACLKASLASGSDTTYHAHLLDCAEKLGAESDGE